jgi:hypothetical protein
MDGWVSGRAGVRGMAAWAFGAIGLLAGCDPPPLPEPPPVDPARAAGGESPEPTAAPGAPAYDLTGPGPGACANSTLEAVIAGVHRSWPELTDVTRLSRPDPDRGGGDGSRIYAFLQEQAFALAFRRGGGDCPAGCTENEYWYFVTDDTCTARQVGHYRAAWATGTCLSAAGAPLWGLPSPPDPMVVCRTENHPQP